MGDRNPTGSGDCGAHNGEEGHQESTFEELINLAKQELSVAARNKARGVKTAALYGVTKAVALLMAAELLLYQPEEDAFPCKDKQCIGRGKHGPWCWYSHDHGDDERRSTHGK